MPLDRSALRAAYRMDEAACVGERLRQATPASQVHPEASALAARLIEGARARKAGGIDAFLVTYGLGTEEGIALMCLAEALLRVPDEETADALIRDKLAGIDWAEHLGESSSTFVNAATFSLMLTGQVLRGGSRAEAGLANGLRRAVGRLGEPVIRQATLQAMRILGGQFVFGRTMDEALKRAAPERKRGLTHSFDMLGEAAMTFEDAERYRQSYARAIARLAKESKAGMRRSPGISVKLSALYPKYDFYHADAAKAALVPMVRELAMAARAADIHFTVDAEEAERLELSMDVIEALVADDGLFAGGWEGFGLALQAYQKRAAPLCDWVAALARKQGRRLMVRLVKGAYWDSEIKLSQVGGYPDYPVFTRKIATDVSYLACAAKPRRNDADEVARRCGVGPLGITPYRRTVVQLRCPDAPAQFPLIVGLPGTFYFKPEGMGHLWLSPHDEIPDLPRDVAPEELDVALAIERFRAVVDWRIAAIEHRWAGLRSFAPDRRPVYGYDPRKSGFFWFAGQGGFGIQTAPAAALIGAALVLGEPLPTPVSTIDIAAYAPDRLLAT